MKEIFNLYKINSLTFLLCSIVYALIMTIFYFLSSFLSLGIPLIPLFVMIPFMASFIFISLKTLDNKDVDYKEIYFGYHNFKLIFKPLLKNLVWPFLLCLIMTLVFYFVFFTIDLCTFDKKILENILLHFEYGMNYEIVITPETYPETNLRVICCLLLAVAFSFVFFNLFFNKCLISLIYRMKVNKKFINYDYLVERKMYEVKPKTFKYDAFASLFYIISLLVAIIIYYTFNFFELMNPLLINLICSLIFFLISSFGLPFKYLYYAKIFNEIFGEEAQKIIKSN